jgi:hypothetical protein
MKSYTIYYKQFGTTQERQTQPIAGVDEKDAIADFRRNALDPFIVTRTEEVKNTYLCAYAGEYARVQAPTETEALSIAQDDYHIGTRDRVLDWKECDYEEKWVVMKTI